MNKKEIRQSIRTLKKQLCPEKRQELSEKICHYVYKEVRDLEATTIALYLSLPDEVDTTKLIELLIKQGKHTLVVPRVEDETTIRFYPLEQISNNLQVSQYGILEPTAEIEKEVTPSIMIVPGIAFDLNGGRIGRGKGYYDRYFEKHSDHIKQRMAIAYQFQVISSGVPMDTHDQRMDVLITEEGRKQIQ